MISDSAVGLVFRAKGDTADARKAFKELKEQIAADVKTVENELDKVDGAGKRGFSSFSAYTDGAGKSLKNFVSYLPTAAIVGLSALLVSGGRAVLDYSSRLEQTKIGFETLTKSASGSAQLLKELQDLAQTTPFEFADLTDFAKRLLASNVELSKVTPLLKDIGNAVAAVGGSREDLEGTIRAITQIISKGKVSAEEINQLAERNINGFRILAEQTGRSEAQIRKLAEAGKISSDVFVKAFQQFSQQNFSDAMQRQSQTFDGALSNIKDSLLIAASTYFEPLFKQISKIGVDTAKEIQGADLSESFRILARNSAKGFGEALRLELQQELKNFKGGDTQLPYQLGVDSSREFFNLKDGETIFTKFKQTYDQNGGAAFFGYLGAKYADSFNEGFQKGLPKLSNEQFKTFADNFQKIFYTGIDYKGFEGGSKIFLDSATNTIKIITEAVKNVPSLAERLKADQADAELEKAKKQADTLRSVIENLNSQVAFFGDNTEVAATKQRLLNAGITDFTTEGAKTALTMAQVLDNLKRAQKQQEDYNKQVEKSAEYMKTLRENALFEIQFPNANKLQQFDQYVKQNAASFKDLKFEMEATRRILESQEFQKNFKSFGDATKAAFVGLETVLTNLKAKTTDLSAPLVDFALKFNITDGILRGFEDNPTTRAAGFAKDVGTLIDTYEATTKRLNELTADFTDQNEAKKQQVIDASQAQEEAYRQLYDYLETLSVKLEDGKILKLFGERGGDTARKFVEKIQAIRKAVADDKLTESLKTLDGIFESLNLRIGDVGAKTELEKLNVLLSDPAITEAIKLRAAALGYTVEQLKELIRLKAENDADPRSTGTRPRVVGEEESGGFLDEFKAGFEFLTDDKFNAAFASASGTLTAFGGLAAEVFKDLTNAVGGAIEQWALYGGSVGKALKQALAAELAHVAGIATINALYATALGFIRLAEFNFPAAGWAFLSAGMWAALAGGSALAARALSDKNKAVENANYQQVSGNSQNGQRDSKSGAGAYSSFGDKVTDVGNTPINEPQQIDVSVTVKTDRDSVIEIIEQEVSRDRSPMGGRILSLIQRHVNSSGGF